MDILWSIELGVEDIFQPSCTCNFFYYNDYLYYSFSTVNKDIITSKGRCGESLFTYKINPVSGEYTKYLYDFSNDGKILLSDEWHYFIDNGLIIYIGKYLRILEDKIILENTYPKNIMHKNLSHEYIFDEIIIKYNGEKKLYCINKSNGKELWNITLIGYLYTEIEYKDGNIIFGTSGMGSVLYTIELESGIIKRNDNNARASRYSWYNDTIILPDKKGNIQIVNPYANETIDNYKIKNGKLTDYSPIKIYENKIFTIAFNNKNRGKIVCIKI